MIRRAAVIAAAIAALGYAFIVLPAAGAAEEEIDAGTGDLLAILRQAPFFEGAGVGFAGAVSPARQAFEMLLGERRAEPFRRLLEAREPAARVYGIHGLAELVERRDRDRIIRLLDDESEVHLFLSCEHSRGQVASEAFRTLERWMQPEEIDALAARIFREAAAGPGLPLKAQLALLRARARPTAASLGFLLIQYRDEEGGAALLDADGDRDPERRRLRIEAVERALSSTVPELRTGALGAAAEIGAGRFLDAIAARCGDREPEVATAALGALARAARAAGSPDEAGGRWTAAAAAIRESRRALGGTHALRRAAAAALIEVAGAVSSLLDPTEGTARPEVPEELRRGLLDALAEGLVKVPVGAADLARAIARADAGGARAVEILEGDFSELDPTSFAALSVSASAAADGRARLIERLRRLIEDAGAHWKMRLYAARALGELRVEAALPALESLARDEDSRLAAEARKAIDAMK